MISYPFKSIEKKWQKIWQKEKVYEPNLKNAKKPFYNLMMFPYPSAEGLHVGNMYAFTGSDIYGRFKRMQGYDVFEPIGLDGFGIHSENYALKIGAHPMKQAEISEKRFYEQLEMLGDGFAWDERLETYDPRYYKWTQWIFIQLFKNGLAYRKKAPVNWCPSCKTVLADEQVINGRCERCSSTVIKKELEQWFFRITKYAERLLKNLENLPDRQAGIDWSEKVKIAQRNWIGKSEGALIKFPISNFQFPIEVFTTRPDTLFGATYMVLAPEHPLVASLLEMRNEKLEIRNRDEVKRYIRRAKAKSEEERVAEGRDPSTGSGQGKTGVELKGIKAINPATKEEIPVWVADYVLLGYGTGAIMAVPAHDERDFEFAKKYKLPVKQVIAPYFSTNEGKDAIREDKQTIRRKTAYAFLWDRKNNRYLCLDWEKFGWHSGIIGGVKDNEDYIKAAKREIREETGYKDVKFVKYLAGEIHNHFFAAHKDVNRYAVGQGMLFELASDKKEDVAAEHLKYHKPVWIGAEKMRDWLNLENFKYMWQVLEEGKECFIGDGAVINSGKFSGMASEVAKWAITKFVGGKRKVQYRLRDWLISRQRYWGPPIPMIYCPACTKASAGKENAGWQPVKEEDLPVRLPFIKNFRPKGKGESPLASVKSFYEVKCPKCGSKARRETDVSDTFLDSAWYYLRYPSVRDKIHSWNPTITKKWLPVDMYIGGAEHSVLHLLYSRFLAMALHGFGFLHFEEPFAKFRAHGLLIKEGGKMSKSKGNIVNPDEYIKKFGADTLRMYLMFLAPFEQGGDFRDAGIPGISRFLRRVWELGHNANDADKYATKNLNNLVHRTIRKVSEDIENLRYNTAISALMILLNEFEKSDKPLVISHLRIFLKLLAPFAPHLSEELWQGLRERARTNKGSRKSAKRVSHKFASIHLEKWPKYDERLIEEKTFTLIIQVNGKVRDSVEAPVNLSKKDAEILAFGRERIKNILGYSKPKKIIYVPNRLINIVV